MSPTVWWLWPWALPSWISCQWENTTSACKYIHESVREWNMAWVFNELKASEMSLYSMKNCCRAQTPSSMLFKTVALAQSKKKQPQVEYGLISHAMCMEIRKCVYQLYSVPYALGLTFCVELFNAVLRIDMQHTWIANEQWEKARQVNFTVWVSKNKQFSYYSSKQGDSEKYKLDRTEQSFNSYAEKCGIWNMLSHFTCRLPLACYNIDGIWNNSQYSPTG